jgi:hypothetical protein
MSEVSIKLQGGLGNFLFQIATAYAYSKKFNKELSLSKEEAVVVHKNIDTYKDNVLKSIKFSNFINPQIQHEEVGFHYSELPNYSDKNVLLRGYFQSEKYFKEYESEIRKLFTSYEIEIDENLKNILSNENTCSIHVRRGDFLKHPNHHPVQNMNYFLKAIKQMSKDSIFLVFSDDIQWCKENFPDIPEKFKFIEGMEDYEDLFIMSKCKNNIICNSTFSWWGAWLNNNSNKIVVAPSKWFGDAYASYDTSDLYCNGWIKI